MAKNKLMEERHQNSQRNKRVMKIAACSYLRSSGGGCRECRYYGTKECIYASNPINEELLRA